MTGKKRTAMTPGLVIAIPLGNEKYGYCRLLRSGHAEFFDLETTGREHPAVADIAGKPVLFVIGLMMDILKRSSWEPLDVVPLTGAEESAVHKYFKQDMISKKITVYWDEPDGSAWHEEPATFEQVQGMERVAGWSANHVEDRLRDHFAGVENKWVKSLAPKPA